jgi:formylglycine-generating enzyme required for sulfatase activity
MKFKLIPAGEFVMGQKDVAEPVHRVKISRDFYMGIYQVTQREWEQVMEYNPSEFRNPNLPVTNVSWYESQLFCVKLIELEPENKYRLPTEAEWEYACRAGSQTLFYFDHKKEKLDEYMWYFQNSETTQDVTVEKGLINKKSVEVSKTGRMPHPVGKLRSNKFGLYDMHGNVYEWCQDWFSDYPSKLVVDPVGEPKEKALKCRILRGGSYLNFAGYGSSAHRDSKVPDYKSEGVGVRLVREV